MPYPYNKQVEALPYLIHDIQAGDDEVIHGLGTTQGRSNLVEIDLQLTNLGLEEGLLLSEGLFLAQGHKLQTLQMLLIPHIGLLDNLISDSPHITREQVILLLGVVHGSLKMSHGLDKGIFLRSLTPYDGLELSLDILGS